MSKEYTIHDLYDIYCEAMPRYPLTYERFKGFLHSDNSQILTAENDKTIIGFCVVSGNSVVVLCVKKEYRHSGYGKHLLIMAEGFISADHDEVVLGGGGLFQGVPCDNDEESSVPFFEKRGYTAEWTSVNMGLELDEKSAAILKATPRPDGITYRFATDSDREKLLVAVKDAQSDWLPIFEENKDAPVLLSVFGDEIAGFEMVEEDGGMFFADNEKHGMIGCVGVTHKYRRRGIGLAMTAEGSLSLYEKNCKDIQLLYVERIAWYNKLGYEVTSRQWMGRKKIQDIIF